MGSHERHIVLTPEGRQRIQEELEHLRNVKRKEVTERLQTAREEADTWDNPELQEAKNEQAFVEGRIRTLEDLLADATESKEEIEPGTVRVGAHVTVQDDEGERDVFTIVGSAEANPGAGRISNESPVGRALVGHRVGDRVSVSTPAGERGFTILAVE